MEKTIHATYTQRTSNKHPTSTNPTNMRRGNTHETHNQHQVNVRRDTSDRETTLQHPQTCPDQFQHSVTFYTLV